MEIAQDLIRLGWILVQAGVIIFILVVIMIVVVTVIVGAIKSLFAAKKQRRDAEKIKEQFEVALEGLKKEVEKVKSQSPGSEFGEYKFERKQD